MSVDFTKLKNVKKRAGKVCFSARHGLAKYSSRAFSLVEVSLALGIIAFALVGIMGLMPVGMRAMNDARDDTCQALISRRLMSELKRSSYSAMLTSQKDLRYFDAEGQEVLNTSPMAVYMVEVRTATSGPNLATISIIFSRPGLASSATTNVSYAARY